MMTVAIDELYPFYLGHSSKQTFDGEKLAVAVECGCSGVLQPDNRWEMNLCLRHENEVVAEAQGQVATENRRLDVSDSTPERSLTHWQS